MITPDQLAKSGSEHGIQSGLFAWSAVATVNGFKIADAWAEGGKIDDLRARMLIEPRPELRWLHAIPNGGARGDDEKSRAIRGGQMKAEGVRDGVADIFWPVARFPYHGLYIEMKTPTGRIRPVQNEFRTFALDQGYAFSFERTWRDAAALIQSYFMGLNILNLKEK